jgi:hypothetical protein
MEFNIYEIVPLMGKNVSPCQSACTLSKRKTKAATELQKSVQTLTP